MHIATDIGGTYTDFVIFRDGNIETFKVLSSEDAVRKGMNIVGGSKIFSHGTTIATNTIIERKGARVYLFVTKGFGDILEIQRQVRVSVYSLSARKVKHIVQSENVVEIDERMKFDGTPYKKLTKNECIRKARIPKDAESVAVVFLHSYKNDSHEKLMKECLKELGIEHISLSSEILPVYREYERASTTALDAYVKPIVTKYISKIRREINTKDFYIMLSSGGVADAENVMKKPINLVLSGPAGGLIASKYISSIIDEDNIITMDMGGTSTDIGIISCGKIIKTESWDISGLPIALPSIDIVTIGAGGGSIIWMDEGGALRVGPQSAGSMPGPACYPFEGKEFTVTDAILLKGILKDGAGLSDDIKLNKSKCERVLSKKIKIWGGDAEDYFDGGWHVVNSNMADAIKTQCSRHGIDPRNFSLLAFGGEGPVHACNVAMEVGIRRVIIPPYAGVFSALGIAMSPITLIDVRTLIGEINDVWEDVVETSENMIERMSERVEGLPIKEHIFSKHLGMRYRGQSFEIDIPMKASLEETVDEFMKRYEIMYSFRLEDWKIECVNIKIEYCGIREKIEIPKMKKMKKVIGLRDVIGIGKVHVYPNRACILCEEISGPVILQEKECTVFVPEGWSMNVRENGIIICEEIK